MTNSYSLISIIIQRSAYRGMYNKNIKIEPPGNVERHNLIQLTNHIHPSQELTSSTIIAHERNGTISTFLQQCASAMRAALSLSISSLLISSHSYYTELVWTSCNIGYATCFAF